MATQTSLFTFTGKAGNMIGYYREGKHYFRSMPAQVRQTFATRRAAPRFGVASKKGRLIRSAFAHDLDVRCDGSYINRLNKLLIQAGSNNHGALADFRFNRYTGTDKFFTKAPTLARNGILHIPAQTLPQFKGVTTLEVKVIASRIHFAERRVVNTETALLSLHPNEAFAGAALDVDVPGKGTLIVTLQVRAMYGNDASRNRKYLAADIIAVKEPGTAEVFQKPAYPQPASFFASPSPQQVTAQNRLADSGKLRPDKTAIQRE
ncbi:hypothetical protein [Chitinophaga cymbidii]|uniref:Uncharacterized protein n=1 Tax=Chitinophaga cymbidii TaxID=1096750 RepID=A0A512RNY0_9BACT|nr:hypothetical protein [Chitinophaga cymbidii]GEP97391.1 hypothetical protein CCY01nite_36510 [Chitinophaga cymbidii]